MSLEEQVHTLNKRNRSLDRLEPVSSLRDSPSSSAELEKKILDRTARLGVIGLGYVGLPLAIEMARQGFQVTGIDIDRIKVESVNAGISYIVDVPSESFFSLVVDGGLRATQSLAAVESLDAMSICVPTPLRKTRDPDLSYVIASAEAVHNHLRPGQLIVIESTTYPGTTREVVLPILERSGLKVGKDFFLAYSPERVDPGNRRYGTKNIPKIVGGMTPECTQVGALLYQQFIDTIVTVSSSEAAEMVKLLENTFRSVNIALANELALMCHNFGINVWEIIEAATTKPFGFMPFYPGLGVEGSVLPVAWKSRVSGFEPRLIEVAGVINKQMPTFTVSRIADALNKDRKSLNGSTIVAIGVTYKRDANDIRESPALDVVRQLLEKGAAVSYSDPYVPIVEIGDKPVASVPVTPELLRSADCVVILTDHSIFDYSIIANHSRLVLDFRNALRNFPGSHIICL
ncbi:MAG TPA: nucleotide sugar dehydrogenase [Candidatus Binatia bacterium]